MKTLWFVTPGKFPLDAFTTFGTNVKPNTTNPIGHFGTGLKYAVAIVLRLGGSITLYTGGAEYGFYLERKDFRGKVFERVRMRSRKLMPLTKYRSISLPFTTELGKNWKGWQAYRELMSNTIDENGWLNTAPPTANGDDLTRTGSGNYSVLEVNCDAVHEAYLMNEAFMANSGELLWEDEDVEIRSGGSKHLYYRGIRVYDLRYPSRVTYNFKSGVVLSEDRTAANIWLLLWNLRKKIQEKVDVPELLTLLVRKEYNPTLEGEDMGFDYGEEKSTVFHSTVADLGRSGGLSRSAGNYWQLANKSEPKQIVISFTQEEWRQIVNALEEHPTFADEGMGEAVVKKIRGVLLAQSAGEEIPF